MAGRDRMLMANLALECATASDRLRDLQCDLDRIMQMNLADADLVRSMQALDAVQQTALDLSNLFEVLACSDIEDGPRLTLLGKAAVRQISLQRRLFDNRREKSGALGIDPDDLEIW